MKSSYITVRIQSQIAFPKHPESNPFANSTCLAASY